MKTGIGASLLAHYALDTTTLATCWKVTRVDAQVFGFTSAAQDLLLSGVTYAAATGFTPTNIETNAALSVDNLEVNSVLDASAVTEADLLAGVWDYATVEIFEVNWADLTMGVNQLRKGHLGEVRVGRSEFFAELRGLAQALQQEIGRLLMPACPYDLGDASCSVTLASYTVTGTLTAVAGNANFTDSARAEATDYFTYGKITWTGGLNDGLSMEVKAFTSGGVFELQLPMPYTVAVGDTYSVSAGCNKLLKLDDGSYGGDCKVKFNNVVNFGGFAELPGVDRMVSGK